MGTFPFLEEWKMKAGNCWKWRPAMGVVVAGALAFAVSVQGGPRATDGKTALNKGRARSDTARLLTGSSPVVAGAGETAFMALTPVYYNGAGNPYDQAPTGAGYGPGDISGQTLTVNAGGFRAFFHAEAGQWDSTGGSGVMSRSEQMRVDSKSFQGANAVPANPGCDILQFSDPSIQIPCANTGVCIAAFNSVGAPKCGDAIAGICNWGWVNTSKDPHYDGKQWVHSNTFGSVTADWGLVSPTGPLCLLSAEPSEPRPDDKYPAAYYLGTLALWVPECAKGTYTLDFVADETFLADADSVVFPDLGVPINFRQAIITIPVGKCCYGIGTGGAGCEDALTQGECAEKAAPYVWGMGEFCDNPPSDDGCAECLEDADCHEVPADDKCTNDTCDGNLICHNDPIPAWNQATECCDAATGDTCVPTPDNVCQTAACSLADMRGVCVNTSIPEGDPCTGEGDDNPCTYDDICAADESCSGTDVNSQMISCVDDAECQTITGLTAPTCVSGICDCSLVPDLTIYKVESDNKDGHCFDSGDDGDKVTAYVRAAAATAAVNGGQFLITYDPTCLEYISAAGVAPYVDAVYGPIVDEAAGTIFVVVGVGFGAGDGPAGNADMLALSFKKVGECNSCQLCFASNNPENTYLVDNTGQRIGVNPICSKSILADGEVEVVVPDSQRNLNVDCDQPTKVVTWDAPYATDTCGEATIMCWGENEGGGLYSEAMAMGGGELPIGISNFCCYAVSDWCGDWAGCAPGMDCPATPSDKEGFFDVDGCWTVDINDETSLDIELQLSPTVDAKPGTDLTRCIKFTLYPNTIQEPLRFTADVEFGNTVGGAMMDHVGKVKDKIKIPGHDQWDCISAWDQLHTLRACYLFATDGSDCIDGQLQASFTGDPLFGGNWLIGGNLDGWKKDVDGAEPSLFVIDVLDYGTFVAEWGADYGTGDTPCGTPGPNADIDGDGDVDLDDYAYIQMNFLASAKDCCGVYGLPAGAQGVTSISVRELREMGRGELAVGDLNGDGMLDMSDMDAFMQGARPVTKGSRTGTR
jgi:hypothetical protein